MPNYVQYKKMMAVLDYDDSDIESWITVKGNHIPIRKGQTKEEAVKSFVEKKQGKSGSGESSASHEKGDYTIAHKDKSGNTTIIAEVSHHTIGGEKKEYDPDFDVVRKNAKANPNLYGGKYTQKSKAEAYKEYKSDTNKIKLKDKDGNEHWVDIASIEEDPDTLPSVGRYKEYLNEITKLTGMTIESARQKYGSYTEGQWKDLFAAKKDTATAPKESESDLKKLRGSFGDHYDKLYNSQYLDDKYNYLVGEYEKKMEDPEFKKQVQKFVEARGDALTSDREVKAFMLAAKENGLIPQENEAAKGMSKTAEAKKSDSPLVNAVAKALNKSPAEAEKEIEGAAQWVRDMMKADDLRSGDVEETLRGLGVESDYAEELMQWASGPSKKTTPPKEVKQYTYHTDAGHGWLEVPLKELEDLDIDITPYSYADKNNAYLEEDVDGPAFMKAYEKKYGVRPNTIEHYNGQSSPIRQMRSYKRKAKKQQSIPEMAGDLAKMTVKGMTEQERKEWEKIFADVD